MIYFYLLTILDNVNTAACVCCGLSGIYTAIISILMGVFIAEGQPSEEEIKDTIKLYKLKITWVVFLISGIVLTLLPTTKQAAFIWIAPQIVENGAVKDTVKNIPELTKLGTDYLKDLLKEKIKND